MEKRKKDNRRVAIFRLTDRCNQKCFFCCQKGRGLGEEPDFAGVKKDLEELRREDIFSIVFMQGESLMRKDLPEIIDLCRKAGFNKIGVATNGTRLADPQLLETLLELGVNNIEISIHSHLKEPANLISGRSFTWDKQRLAMENLERVQHRLIHLKLNTVICRHNMNHLPELADYFFSRIAIPRAEMMVKHPFMMGAAAGDTENIPSYGDLDISRFLCHIMDNRLRVKIENLPLCLTPGLEHLSSEAIDRVRNHVYYSRLDGEVSYRDKREGSDCRVLLDSCGPCSLVSLCRGVDARYIEAFGSPELIPSRTDPLKVVSKILAKKF